MSDKPSRQRRIRELLQRQSVHSQDELHRLLAREGFHATQATLSRDLRDLGVLKGHDGYALPGDAPAPPPGATLERALKDYLVSATQAGNLVVLRTGPGHAPPLALELDRARPEAVIGTIAGDDTIFVATPTAAAATHILEDLLTKAGRPVPKPARRAKVGSYA